MKEPLRFDRLKTYQFQAKFADQLEEKAQPLLAEILGANVSKLVLFLNTFDVIMSSSLTSS